MLNEDPVDLQFNQSGYLFLANEDTAHIMEENYRTQRSALLDKHSPISWLWFVDVFGLFGCDSGS